jgi:hypothetical protein
MDRDLDVWRPLLPDGADATRLILDRLTWYREQMANARWKYLSLEVVLIVVGASVSVAAAANLSRTLIAVLGAVTAAGVGMRSLFGWRDSWATFSTTRAAIEFEVVRYHAGAKPYDAADREANTRLLEVIVQQLVNSETAGWADRTRSSRTPGSPSRTTPSPKST